MNLHRTIIAALRVVLFVGLFVAYGGAGVGLVGLSDARTVSLIILIGAIVAFVAMLLYFGASDFALRQKLRRELSIR
jgi:hypothetical protein